MGQTAIVLGVLLSFSAVATPVDSGIVFHCGATELAQVEKDMDLFFAEIDFPKGQVVVEKTGSSLRYRLNSPSGETSTLSLAANKKLGIHPEILSYRRYDGKVMQNAFTSRKEIVAALMQNGREYSLSAKRCNVASLRQHVGVRQNIAKWNKVAESRWIFPEEWNAKHVLIEKESVFNPLYWVSSSELAKGASVFDAVADPFVGKFQYEIYCLFAAKLVITQGIYDYFANVARDTSKLAWLEKAANGEPVSGIKPSVDDMDREIRPGKYLKFYSNVPGDNWIPGDWAYIFNTDKVSRERAGYEGSNFVYQGGGMISSFWAENPSAGHATDYFSGSLKATVENHLLEVYHWRHGITENWQNDPRRKFLTQTQVDELFKDPKHGGLLGDFRSAWADGVSLPDGSSVLF